MDVFDIGFLALGVAARIGLDVRSAARDFGLRAADMGMPLAQVMGAMEKSFAPAEPPFAVVKEVSVAWSTRSRLTNLETSCSDPLTLMATGAHLREHLEGVYRVAERDGHRMSESSILIVVDLHHEMQNPLEKAVSALDVGVALRTVFCGDEVIASLTPRRFLVVTERRRVDDDTFAVVAVLLRRAAGVPSPRVWTESLPDDPAHLTGALDALLA